MELLAMSRDPSVPLANIVKAVSLDQALAAKVLRTANSAYFGRSGTISRLEDAISTIGIHNFRTTIITTGLLKALPDVRIPRHLDTQPTIIWTLVPCSLGHLIHVHLDRQSERSDAGLHC
ncbi:HDOD domain-containing protein [Pseudomonas putida]|uniref:HDOD domain-containing protein n=2 Tax=Pseudomonas putida TaxID=303 RepID=UPI003D188D73